MGCNVNLCGCPFQARIMRYAAKCRGTHQQMQQMQVREARYLSSPGGSVKGGQKALCPRSRDTLPSICSRCTGCKCGNKRPFLHFKAASFSTPSLRVMIWGTRSAQAGFALKAIPLPGQTCSVQLHRRHSPWRSSPSFLHPFVTPPRSTPSYPSYPSSVVVLY